MNQRYALIVLGLFVITSHSFSQYSIFTSVSSTQQERWFGVGLQLDSVRLKPRVEVQCGIGSTFVQRHFYPQVSVAILAGFLSLHIIEGVFGSHEPAESDYGHEHEHSSNIAGAFGALAMGGHVFLDGVALGVAFSVSNNLGVAVFIALLVHAFSDGLNTVSFLIKSGSWSKKGLWLLGVDAIARISGAAIGSSFAVNDNFVGLYLALFAGIVIYLATSHILPEAHSRHKSRYTIMATIVGVVVMWALVGSLHGME